MLLVSPLTRVAQKRPFEDEACPLVEECPKVSWEITSTATAELKAAKAPVRSEGCTEVFLNIYDVTHDSTIQQINGIFASQWSPLKFGGIFHVGVEISNVEWSYGYTTSGTGVVCGVPRSEHQHHFRERVCLPTSKLSLQEIDEVLRDLFAEYKGREYNMLEKNCCHFAQDFCQRLGVGPIPAWVHRMGRLGDSLKKASGNFGDQVAGLRLSCGSEGPSESRHRCADSKRRETAGNGKAKKLVDV